MIYSKRLTTPPAGWVTASPMVDWIEPDDGGGTTATFHWGIITVFTAYEGPDSGYCGQNYNGANGLLIDQWLISPAITVSVGDTLSFWYKIHNHYRHCL